MTTTTQRQDADTVEIDLACLPERKPEAKEAFSSYWLSDDEFLLLLDQFKQRFAPKQQ